MVDRKFRGRYFIAFILTLFIFLIGIYFGSYMSDIKINKINSFERDLARNYLLYDVQNELLGSDPCSFVNSTFISYDIFSVGNRLEALEGERGKNDEEVISLKKYYTLLEIREYLFYKKVNKECNSDFILNLFFYSNDPEKCPKCQDQGLVLNYARQIDNTLRTYSFDVDLDMPTVNHLMTYYGVIEIPATVVMDTTYNTFLDYDNILVALVVNKTVSEINGTT